MQSQAQAVKVGGAQRRDGRVMDSRVMDSLAMDGPVRLALDDGVAVLTLARAAQANALDPALAEALLAGFMALGAQPQVRAVLLQADGPRFGVGGDLAGFDVPNPAASAEAARQVLRPLHALMQALRDSPLPVVCAVRGVAAGGSLALALACDLGVWADDCRLVPAYAALGATPDCGLTWTLARALGPQRALQWLLDGSALTGAQARDLGLLHQVLPDAQVAEAALALARRLAALPPQAVAATKQLVHRAPLQAWPEQLAQEYQSFVACAQSEAFGRRVRALRQRRVVAPGRP